MSGSDIGDDHKEYFAGDAALLVRLLVVVPELSLE
jgi:hypothetical protein